MREVFYCFEPAQKQEGAVRAHIPEFAALKFAITAPEWELVEGGRDYIGAGVYRISFKYSNKNGKTESRVIYVCER